MTLEPSLVTYEAEAPIVLAETLISFITDFQFTLEFHDNFEKNKLTY